MRKDSNLLLAIQLIMQKKNVFVENLQMETQTVFNQNGNINIYPCGFEMGQHIVNDGNRASQKGRMVTEDDGSRYNTLFRTAHGEVKETLDTVIFQLRFPKKLGKALIEALYHDETCEQAAFIKTRQTETMW